MRMRHLQHIKDARFENGSLVTIGVFDGVHIGHQTLIERLIERARVAQREAVVVTFFPHPDKVLDDVIERYYLMTPDRRAELLLALGVDLVITQTFDDDLRLLPAQQFVDLLIENLRMKELWVGADFAFGFQRQGDIAFLRSQGRQHGFTVTAIDLITAGAGDKFISSSSVREHVRRGEMVAAKSLLGRAFTLEGTVIRGEQRGSSIGVPTANIEVWSEQIIPARGVYATRARLGEESFMAATNIGLRPTFSGDHQSIETHLLDFDRDIYGQRLELRFEKRLRPERKFARLEALVGQIRADLVAARAFLLGDAEI